MQQSLSLLNEPARFLGKHPQFPFLAIDGYA